MKTIIFITIGLIVFFLSCGQMHKPSEQNIELTVAESIPESQQDSTWKKLTKEEENVIVYKGTEIPWTGVYNDNHEDGTYHCKRCNAPLFTSESKFDSRSGWPSFDEFIANSVELVKDDDGYREEIICANCKGHLGHVFYNEGFTNKETRHCVNSISLNFVPNK